MAPMSQMENIQGFRFSDALRCTWHGMPRGPNLANPRERVAGPAATWPGGVIWQDAAMTSKHRVSLGYWDGKKLRGMVSARSRPGHKSWEIDRLYLSGKWESLKSWDYSYSELDELGWFDDFPVEGAGVELLEQLNTAVGCRAAQRVYLRLPVNSPARTVAKRSGFTDGVTETLLESYGGNAGGALPPGEGPQGMRPVEPPDEFGLFQLYCASAPAKAREALGLTFDQWQEHRDMGTSLFKPAGFKEWVADGPQRLAGWLRITRRWVIVDVQTMTHPDHPEALYPAMDYALAQPGIQRWLVPSYQESVSARLENRGFRRVAEYTLMVKIVAVPAFHYGMAPVEA